MTPRSLLVLLATGAIFATTAVSAWAADAPSLSVTSLASPTNFKPGDSSIDYSYDLRIANLGAAPTNGNDITITDTLPAGLVVESVEMILRSSNPEGRKDYGSSSCEVTKADEVETVTCTISESLSEAVEPALIQPGEERRVVIHVSPENVSEGEALTNHVVAAVQGGSPPSASSSADNEASSTPASGGISFFHASLTEADGLLAEQAGSHPYQFNFGFAVNTKPAPEGATAAFVPAGGDIKDISVPLPAGFVGNPNATTRCTAVQFNTTHTINIGNAFFAGNDCPDSSAVGVVLVQQIEGAAGITPVPLYNLVPAPGMPAQFGAQILNLPFYIDTEVRPDDHYKIYATLRNLTQVKRLTAASTVLWGTPADPRHDSLRGSCINELEYFPITLPDCEPLPPSVEEKPFLRLPTNCTSPMDMLMSFDNWTHPGEFVSATSPGPVPTGCSQLKFEPTQQARPTTDVADSPSGLHVDLHIPQKEDEESDEIGQADLKEVSVAFPRGLVINPSGANGLDACSPAQVGLTSGPGVQPPTFDAAPAGCPDAAQLGTVEVQTPLLDHPLNGSVYAAAPYNNPFSSLLAIYIAVHDPLTGVVVKLPGKVSADPQSGQLTGTFSEVPQVPFENFKLDFFSGAGAALRTPAVCGPYATNSTLTPWSSPESGPAVNYSDPYVIAKSPSGGICADSEGALPFAPGLRAGTIAPIAAAYTPFLFNLRREDGSQEFSSVTLSPPPGLLGKLAGIPYCPETALVAAAARSGNAEKAAPSCPAASQVGTVTVGAGAGPAPYYAEGKAYLTGPYKGAPLSLAVITPATAGPYDLGTVVVRAALRVDRETARITAVSDPIPRILQGVPLDVRTIAVKLDRPQFTFNPTSCDPMMIDGQALSTLGKIAPLSERFQVGECARLKFAPKLSLRLRGGVKRGAYPRLRAVVTYPKGAYANIARASVALPHSEFLAQEHIRTICTRVQFAASACPKGSIYGHARATSPLIDYAAEGPVYLRSSSNPLPDLVMALHGPPSQPIEVAAVARIDSIRGGIRATLDRVPDVPLSKFVLSMQGGKKSLLVNSRNICAHTNRAVAQFKAQNGKVVDSRPVVKAQCPGKGKPKKKRR